MRIVSVDGGYTMRGPSGEKVFPSRLRIVISQGENPNDDSIIDIEEHSGGVIFEVVHGDSLWRLPVDPRTGRKPNHPILIVDR